MKYTLVLLALMLCGPLMAQTPARNQPSQRADMAVQKECYQQAQTYVSDANKSNDIDPKFFFFSQSHYDPASKICYVDYRHFQGSENSMLWIVDVADAFEGKKIAQFIGTQEKQGDGSFHENPPTTCQVNGKSCSRRAEFNALLWKLIPAFEPLDSKYVN